MKAVLKWLKEGKRLWWVALAMLVIACLYMAVQSPTTATTGGTSEEKRIAEVLSTIAGAGRVEVALFYETEAAAAFGGSAKIRPTGAVVVAEGAADMEVRLSLIRAVRTLLGLPENAVDVFVMEEKR